MGEFIEFIGLEQALAAIDEAVTLTVDAATAASIIEASYDLELTKPQVPILTGQLLASGRVEPVEVDEAAGLILGAIAYGGPAGSGPHQTEDVDYAIQVHEDLYAHHRIGKAKFVEDPVREEFESGRAAARMAKTIEARMAQG